MLSSIKQDYLSKRKQNCDEYNFCPKLPVGPRTSDSSDGLGSLYSVLKKGYFARLKASYDGDAHSPAFLHLNAWKVMYPLSEYACCKRIMMIMVVNHDDDELDW